MIYVVFYKVYTGRYLIMEQKNKADEKLKQMLEKDKRNIRNYNKALSEKISKVKDVESAFEKKDTLRSFSWQLHEIDREAVEDFRRNHDCTYQDIIKYALRYYLSDINYKHSREIIELKKRHDNETDEF